jgi:hypothetical protein
MRDRSLAKRGYSPRDFVSRCLRLALSFCRAFPFCLRDPDMTGPGYWLNPANKKSIAVTRHELAMRDAAALVELDVASHVIDAAQRISPYTREGVDELRIIGIRSGLIRVRDQGSYISVQFEAPTEAKTELLDFVRGFFESNDLWRPYVRVGNLRTNSEVTYSWQEFVDRAAPAHDTERLAFIPSTPRRFTH